MAVDMFRSGAALQFCEEEPIRAVVFEPSGVLYDATPRRRWLWQLVTRLGIRLAYADFIRPWEDLFLPPVQCGKKSYSESMREFLTSLGISAADLSEVEAAMPLRGQSLESGVRPLPGVARVLSRLASSGLQIAALCDCSLPSGELKEQLDQLGLGGFFSAIITSVDLGAIKPEQKNYEAIEATIGCTAAECVMVSSQSADLLGANLRGWRTIAFATGASCQADARVLSVTQMTEIVTHWGSVKLAAIA
jgi:FMN phosphatase YigB (HAD superfamily)